MTKRLAGKCVLITGAGQGIGAAASLHMARHGAKLLLTDIDADRARENARAINEEIGSDVAFSVQHDVTSERDWNTAIETCREWLGGLSVLVNNAGRAISGSIEDLSLDQWRSGMSVNVDSIFLGCKLALPLLRASQPASIINMSSIAGLIAAPSLANYNASKAAVWMLTKSIALHCAKNGWDIRCNSIHPAFIRTPILREIIRNKDDAEIAAKLARQIPLNRVGDPEDVAQAIIYLASDESRFMTGSELKLDGGISAM